MAAAKISAEELKQHTHEDDGWIAIHGDIWDVSGFASLHPGGDIIIKEWLGRDATAIYSTIHSPGLIRSQLGATKKVGLFDSDILPTIKTAKEANAAAAQLRPLKTIVNLHDFEEAASQTLSELAWAQISGATNDSFSKTANAEFYRRIMFRPRILADVTDCDMSREVFGVKFDLPIFNAPASSSKLAHPDGELALGRGLAAMGTTVMIPTLSSFSHEEIVAELPPGHPFFFQLYVHRDRAVTENMLKQVVKLKPVAILLTVDLPVMSKREAKERYKAKSAASTPAKKRDAPQKESRGSDQIVASNLTWGDVKWLRDLTGLPIVLKGIQSAADAKKALEHGCGGIYLSNHGGRALDTAPPSILTLMEIQAECPEVLERMEIFIDGGIRRGTDILKAICLGASAVCLGRPFFYASTYGEEGVKHAIEILSDELRVAMQLSGITSLSQAHPGLLNTTALDPYVLHGPEHPWAKKIVRSRL